MSRRQQPTTFVDLCTAGAPLTAIARCLHDECSCNDQLNLAHAVGKKFRDLVLQEVTHLPALVMDFAHRPAGDFRAAARLMMRLEHVWSVEPAQDAGLNFALCDEEGTMLLRLLPQLSHLSLERLSPFASTPAIYQCVAVLSTLKRLVASANLNDDYLAVHTEQRWDTRQGARSLAQLTQLSYLDVTHFNMDAEGMDHIAELRNLRELRCGCNHLSGANLAPLTGLTSLECHEAAMDHQALVYLRALTALRYLDLDDNDLHPWDIRELGTLKALTFLSLNYNTMDAGSITVLSQLRGLEVLHVAHTGLVAAAAAPFTSLTRLSKLDCSGNELGVEGAQHIAKCTQLRQLVAGCNNLSAQGVVHLSSLVGLVQLCIQENVIGADGAFYIAHCLTNLTSLDMFNNNIGTAGAALLARLTGLQQLDIRCNDIDTLGAQLLSTNLRNLDGTSRQYLELVANSR